MKAVVILPTYNERENIRLLFDKLFQAAKKITRHKLTYLVIDDNSPDGTQEIVREYQKKYLQIKMLTGPKLGLGKALLRAATYAIEKLDAEIIVQMDADLSHDPGSLPAFFLALEKGADFVVGSRYIPGGSIPENWGIHRKIFSIAGNAIVRFGLGYPKIHDWTGGYRLYKKVYLQAVKQELIPYGGYVFQIAFLHKSVKLGGRITEVPINFTDRRFGHSKIAPLRYILNIFSYVLLSRIKQIISGNFWKFCVVGTIGFVINTAILELVVKFGGHPVVGSVLGAELAIISNYILNNNWTFRQRKINGIRQLSKFFQFNLTSCGAIIIQSGTIALGTLFFGVANYRWFYLLGVGIGLIWNYAFYSLVIWKK